MTKGIKYLFTCILAFLLSSFGSIPEKTKGSRDDLMKMASESYRFDREPLTGTLRAMP